MDDPRLGRRWVGEEKDVDQTAIVTVAPILGAPLAPQHLWLPEPRAQRLAVETDQGVVRVRRVGCRTLDRPAGASTKDRDKARHRPEGRPGRSEARGRAARDLRLRSPPAASPPSR